MEFCHYGKVGTLPCVCTRNHPFVIGSGSRSDFSFEIDASPESKDHYLVGHMIDGRVLYPATGYLVLAWRALAKLEGQVFDQMPVSFENVHIHRATILPKTGKMK